VENFFELVHGATLQTVFATGKPDFERELAKITALGARLEFAVAPER
jgi:hypothetical protein